MLRRLLRSTTICLPAVLIAASAFSQTSAPSGSNTLTINVQEAVRKGLEQQKKQLDQRRAELATKRSSVESERQNIAALRRELREARADLARERRSSRKWKCNLSGTEHNDPSECDDPSLGGVWITTPNSNIAGAEQRVRDLEKSLAEAERKYQTDLKAFNSETAQLKADAGQLSADMNRAGYGKKPTLLSGDDASVKAYTKTVADRAWGRNGDKAAQRLQADPELSAALDSAAMGTKSLSAGDLKAITAIEAGANRNTGVNSLGYAGLFQMGPAAAKDVGADYDKLKDPANWKMNVDAGAKYLELNAERLAQKGVPVTGLNVYLAHQQGPNGAARIVQEVQNGSAQTMPANRNMLGNLPASYRNAITALGQRVTVQNYYDYWNDAFQATSSAVNAGPKPLP